MSDISKRNEILKNKRERALKSQTDVSIELNISLTSYSEKERGKRDFTESEMKALAKIFNCTLNDLFWEDTEHAKV
ncbi:helix-turn-helix domain-containing protein [Mammaliicoccus sciuri]|uniref:helix-turn-helix transcriptional regulator n=1 Tax=Mammaliicoccus sciuri TaxID=1296 RepID=UPI001D0D4143|nr:helix-turn-helix transcriptional regulator [Mammaliicoccus sciuri]MCC2087947.1 helix-turn-helix domain-containing protein [Mammaliicoccus sciuri]